MEQESNNPPILSGRELSVDLTTERDRGLIRNAIKERPRRWAGMSAHIKEQCIEQLRRAMEEVESIDNLPERVKARTSIAKTLTMIEAQNQKDEHHAAEVDTPKQVEHRHFVVPPPRLLGEGKE